jgi:SAM-dependent methyltransferase
MKVAVATTPNKRAHEMWLTKLLRNHLEMIRRHYEKAPELNTFAKSYRKLLAHYYNLLIPADASVLEIGCGAGELLSLLRTMAICGIDLSERQINDARKRLPHGRFLVQAAEELSVTGHLDAIVLPASLRAGMTTETIRSRSPARGFGRAVTNTDSHRNGSRGASQRLRPSLRKGVIDG